MLKLWSRQTKLPSSTRSRNVSDHYGFKIFFNKIGSETHAEGTARQRSLSNKWRPVLLNKQVRIKPGESGKRLLRQRQPETTQRNTCRKQEGGRTSMRYDLPSNGTTSG